MAPKDAHDKLTSLGAQGTGRLQARRARRDSPPEPVDDVDHAERRSRDRPRKPTRDAVVSRTGYALAVAGLVALMTATVILINNVTPDPREIPRGVDYQILFPQQIRETRLIVDREWEQRSGANQVFQGITTFKNGGDRQSVSGYEELIPLSLASDIRDLVFTPAYTAISVEGDYRVARYEDFHLDPGEVRTLSWKAKLPSGLHSKERLKVLREKVQGDYDRRPGTPSARTVAIFEVEQDALTIAAGKQDIVRVRGILSDGSPLLAAQVTWSSSKPEVATVDGGKITAIAEGNTTVMAKVGDKLLSVNITVRPPEEAQPKAAPPRPSGEKKPSAPAAGGPSLPGPCTQGPVSDIVGVGGTPRGSGYWRVSGRGSVFCSGDARSYEGAKRSNARMVGMASRASQPSGSWLSSGPGGDNYGYWLVSADGDVFAFGEAVPHGSLPESNVPVNNIVSIAATRSGDGYWLAGADGRVYAFGGASRDDLSGKGISNIVGIAVTSSQLGYWLAGADGKVYAFGGAAEHRPVHPPVNNIVGIAANPLGNGYSLGNGYWLVGANGKVHSFGNAAFHGDVPGESRSVNNIVGIAATPMGDGYWLVSADGSVYAFGSAKRAG